MGVSGLYRNIKDVLLIDGTANAVGAWFVEYEGAQFLVHELEQELWERLFNDYEDDELPEFTDDDYVDLTDNEFFDDYAYEHTIEILEEWL